MQLSEAQSSLCSKLNIDIADVTSGANALFTISDLNDAINDGAKQAWDYKPWTFTEKTYASTLTSGFMSLGYMDYPAAFEDESASRVAVNGVEFVKKNWQDYQRWFADNPTDTSKIWTEHERFIFINVNAVSVGQEADISGKLRCPVLSNSSDLLPFSPQVDAQENSGNVAIVHLAYSHILQSEKKKNPTVAATVEKDALNMLDVLWAPMGERKSEKTSQNRPFFNGHDYFGFGNNPRGSWGRNNTNIGNFP